uniref:Major facilitator superfamily (MFS) profile domain-containing protein n=1 Tax=Arcella intermedia TaxID=1963864 RepID=A0A6B2L3Y7_9EUKA
MDSDSTEVPIAVPVLRIKLTPPFRLSNLIAFYYASLVNVASLVYINGALPYLLSNFLNISEGQQGSRIGDLGLYNELTIIATVTLWGSLSDKIGRRYIYAIGFLLMSISIFIHPTTDNFNVVIVYRIIFAIGAAASVSMLTAVLGDYPTNGSRGRTAGVLGITSGLGALLGLFVFLRIPKWVNTPSTTANGQIMYWCVGGWIAISSVIIALGLSGEINKHNKHVSYSQILTDGFLAARNPRIALSYLSSFAARGDSVVLTSLLSLWITQYETAHGASPEESIAKAGEISGICQLIALLTAPLFGFLADRYDRIVCQIVAAAIATCGYLFLFFLTSPRGALVYIAVCIVGFGEISMVVTSQILVTSESPKDIRGAVSGFFSLAGSLSVLLSTKLGGYLFDHWSPTGPFFLVAMYNIIVLIVSGIIYLKGRLHVAKIQ